MKETRIVEVNLEEYQTLKNVLDGNVICTQLDTIQKMNTKQIPLTDEEEEALELIGLDRCHLCVHKPKDPIEHNSVCTNKCSGMAYSRFYFANPGYTGYYFIEIKNEIHT